MLILVDFKVIVHGKQGPGGGVVLRRVNVILFAYQSDHRFFCWIEQRAEISCYDNQRLVKLRKLRN